MNEYVLRITQSSGLETTLKKLRKRILKKEKKLDEIRDNCKHEVVVFTEEERCYGGYDDNLYQKCLFCGAESASRRSFRESKHIIDVSNFQDGNFFGYDGRNEKFNIVKDLFIKFANENPELSIKEIVNLVEKDLQAQNEEFKKIMDSIHKNSNCVL